MLVNAVLGSMETIGDANEMTNEPKKISAIIRDCSDGSRTRPLLRNGLEGSRPVTDQPKNCSMQ